VARQHARLAGGQRGRVVAGSVGSTRRSWLRELMFSLVNTLPRCYWTVRALMNSCAAISGFDRPSRRVTSNDHAGTAAVARTTWALGLAPRAIKLSPRPLLPADLAPALCLSSLAPSPITHEASPFALTLDPKSSEESSADGR
jgi:hypothetical protein